MDEEAGSRRRFPNEGFVRRSLVIHAHVRCLYICPRATDNKSAEALAIAKAVEMN